MLLIQQLAITLQTIKNATKHIIAMIHPSSVEERTVGRGGTV